MITDVDGNFNVSADKNGVLVISFVGYVTQEVPVAEKQMVIVLKEDTELLDEVVVLGMVRIHVSRTCLLQWV